MLPPGLSVDFDPDGPGADGLFGAGCPVEDALVHVISVPWQPTASYRRGTRYGPRAIHRASLQIDLADPLFGPAYRAGIAWVCGESVVGTRSDALEGDALTVIESGGVAGDPALLARAERVTAGGDAVNQWVAEHARAARALGRIPAVVGGDHSSPFGLLDAVAETEPELGVLHIDAHADLRAAYLGFRWSHASIFHNVLAACPSVTRLVGVGWRDMGAQEQAVVAADPRVMAFTDPLLAREQLRGRPFVDLVHEVVAALPEAVHISVDIDGLDPSLCPNTGTPVPGGLSWREVELLLDEVSRARRIVSFDLCEVSPGPLGVTEEDAWDAIVGARLLYKLCGAAVVSRMRSEGAEWPPHTPDPGGGRLAPSRSGR